MFRFKIATAAAVVAGSAALAAGSATLAAPESPSPTFHLPTAPPGASTICHYVLTSAKGSTPFKLCLTKEQWKIADSRNSDDPNVIECHYTDDPESRLRSYKICQPASAWRQQVYDARDAVERLQRGSCVPGGGC